MSIRSQAPIYKLDLRRTVRSLPHADSTFAQIVVITARGAVAFTHHYLCAINKGFPKITFIVPLRVTSSLFFLLKILDWKI